MNIDDIILKCQIGEEHLDQAEYEQVAKWLEELKQLREKYKNVSEAYMKCNMELFRLMSEKAREE